MVFQRGNDILKILLTIFFIGMVIHPALAQDEQKMIDTAESLAEQNTQVAEQINVEPTANDRAIHQRLTSILEATGWFSDIAVKVEEGVVFLDGRSGSKDNRLWAGALAGKVTDVVAVVNRIQVIEPSPWNIYPAVSEVALLWKSLIQGLPRFGLGLVVLLLVFWVAKFIVYGFRKILDRRLNPLLSDVTARLSFILIFLLGFYLALQVAGLSGLSATVLGGTGIAGLVAGIAFRDLLENYLASILISIRNPFRLGDLVEISDHIGVVERVTTRGTVLMNPDGNHVQIPNSIVYKSIIRNFTANPNRRDMFEVGIGFETNASYAQEVALEVLGNHPAVLKEPEPLVLVDKLGSATVNLVIYFWYDGAAYNGLKVKSSLIRLVKTSFEKEHISMPDEAREIIFPDGVPLRRLEASSDKSVDTLHEKSSGMDRGIEEITTEAEGSLQSEEFQLRDQARMSRTPEEGESLLKE
jgi:small-conductance mechanosensitive channel